MAPPPRIRLIIVIITLISFSALLAETPFDNTIPTLAMRIKGPDVSLKDFTLEFLCELSWLNFDAVNFAGRAANEAFGDLMSLCDSAGVYYAICPAEVMQYLKAWADPEYRYWFRNSQARISSNQAFARCNTTFETILQYMPADSLYFENEVISIDTTIGNLATTTRFHEFLWFYEVYDEANSQQRRHSVEGDATWDDYIPNIYTQDKDTITGYLTLEEVEPSGIFSIQKYYSENHDDNPVTFTMNFALLHSIDSTEYTGLPGDIYYGTMADQATCVRAMMEAEYQYPPPDEDSLVANAPEFICLDYYPFRYVDIDYASTTTMCDDDWLFLIDHFEEGIDSTVIPAHECDVPVYFYPQTFGVAGGPVMWNSSGDTLDYPSYCHRKPASQEFRMLCNLALLHQAKGIFPYNLCSYLSFDSDGNPTRIMSSLLDRHNIPFDADYEEWVYTGRWPDDSLAYIRPDSIPPWIDGYDPLYDLDDPPDTTGQARDQKSKEIWYEWHFGPYAELYNNLYDILADVKWIGSEMYDLWWCSGDYSDGADISYNSSTLPPEDLITPVIKVFEDEAQESCYLFYVDRYCISDDNPYEITFSPSDLPGYADCSIRLLDHSRRFIMEGSVDSCSFPVTYTFLDTLDAGEGRLVQLVDLSGGLPADVRITSSDVRVLQTADSLRMETTVGDSVDILADFYNMGIQSRNNVRVTLYDNTDSVQIGEEYIDFDGLAFRPPCRTCDCSIASFGWRPDSTGVHRFTVTADTWLGEPDSDDNSLDFVFLVKPRDYATEVRDDSWDMDYDSTSNWHTLDIESVDFNWDTTSTGWTDSVSGMFEGVIEFDSTAIYPFRGVISLAIPEDSTEYIDTDRYHMLSMGVTIDNPFEQESSSACSVLLRWWDSNGDSGCSWYGCIPDYNVSNGWDGWSEIGPIDLNDIDSLHWGDDDVSELRLMFQAGDPVILPEDSLFSVRVGWIKLEESAL